MHTSRSLASWINSLVVVSLLMTLVPIQTQAALPRAGGGDRSSPHSRLRNVPPLVEYDSNLAMLPAWWTPANDVSRSEYDSTVIDVAPPLLQITPMPTPTPTPLPQVLPESAPPSYTLPVPVLI
jgi:hypothetical protein